jgi:hypothetical protein
MGLAHARSCVCSRADRTRRSEIMYYGIGGTILVVLVVLFVLGRL